MFLRCPECRARYEISGSKVPEGGVKVRCPRCKAVFQVTREAHEAAVKERARAPLPGTPPGEPDPELAGRIARAMVSELLLTHRDLRDTGLRDGRLHSLLGREIADAWELYKARVTPDVATRTPFFREALNEILAEGRELF